MSTNAKSPAATGSSLPLPWSADSHLFVQSLGESIEFDVASVAVWEVSRPSADEVLVAHGVPASAVSRWVRGGFAQDADLESARTRGAVHMPPSDSETGLLRQMHGLMVMAPESIHAGRWWWLLLGRSASPFSEEERQLAEILLRQWYVAFHHPPEPGMFRLLLGGDDRVLLADLGMQRRMVANPLMLQQLLAALHPVIEQRFPELGDGIERDFAVELEGQPYWVCVRRHRAVTGAAAESWCLELRTLEPGELPTVGVVEDDRIARAIAFLHEQFPSSPSLAQVARAVHTSPFHFHRLFSKHVGISPKQYLQRKQLQVAKWKLRASRDPIGNIATETGFASHGHFTSTFHRIVGVSPSDYRDRYRA